MTDGEATRGLKMGIILLIKKKYRKQHAAAGSETREGERRKSKHKWLLGGGGGEWAGGGGAGGQYDTTKPGDRRTDCDWMVICDILGEDFQSSRFYIYDKCK